MPKSKFKIEDRERMIDEILHPPEEQLKGIAPQIADKIKEIAQKNRVVKPQ